MAEMDVFNSDAFNMINMTDAVMKTDYLPTFLGNQGIFDPKPVETETVAIEKKENTLSLIATSERGAPLAEHNESKRDIRDFRTARIAKGDTINASEIQNVRAFGQSSEFEMVQSKVQERQGQIRDDVELTFENMRLGAIQGIVVDADGSTEIQNWFTNWGITQATEVSFELDVAATDVRGLCMEVRREMRRNSKGSWTPNTQVHALAGDTFFDGLINHAKVRDTFLSWSDAQNLRNNLDFDSFRFGGITFHNYQGTDDNSTVAIPVTEAKFYPVNARNVFQVAQSPGESFDFANTPGQEVYSMLIRDRDRNAWVRVEEYAYPLFICTRPEMLQRARYT